jgi:sugar/nucleoside kinase (ribokinase family)
MGIKEPLSILAGRLQRDYLLPPAGRPLLDVPGGNLLYAAAGLAVWDQSLGLLARVGEDYPHEWIRSFRKRGWDTRGIHILPEHIDQRFFLAYTDLASPQRSNPVAHFARLGLPFPRALLGYQPPCDARDERTTQETTSPRLTDIPKDYLAAPNVHFCPLDYLSISRLLPVFLHAGVTNRTLDPSPAYMNPGAWPDVRQLLHGLSAFLPSEEDLRSLFWGETDDLWAMAEAVAACGCEMVVIRRGVRGQLLYDAGAKKRWEVPAYPSRLVDPTGAGDSFCGGFLVGFYQTYDPVRAALYGNASASLTVEGSGAFYALEAMPGLAQARLDSLAGGVRQV